MSLDDAPDCLGEGPFIPNWTDQDTAEKTMREHYEAKCARCEFWDDCLFASEVRCGRIMRVYESMWVRRGRAED